MNKIGLCHNDFKTENIFIGFDDKIRIGDFGFCSKNTKKLIKNWWWGTSFYHSPNQKKKYLLNEDLMICFNWEFLYSFCSPVNSPFLILKIMKEKLFVRLIISYLVILLQIIGNLLIKMIN